MRQKTTSQLRPLLFAACLGLLALGALAQEGYDPLRPIQQRIAKQNVILLLDNSPTMAEVPSFSYYSQTTLVPVSGLMAGADSTGAAPVAVSFLATKDNGTGAACNPTTKGRNHYFTYTISQVLPSKMAFMKNALGNSMNAYAVWLPPASWTYSGTTWTGSRPTITHAWNAGTATLTWTLKWTKSYATCTNAPNAPYADAAAVVALQPAITAMPPQNLLSAYSQTVNFGLYSFSGTSASGVILQSAADLTDGSANLSTLNTKMHLATASGVPVTTTAGKPTYCAVAEAAAALNGYYSTPDPKRNCPGRGYAILLITDGLADQCNPGGGAWATCSPGNYTNYLPGATEAAWNTSTGRNFRTWVLGLGSQVNKCELNWAAFMGRTDASRTSDFGFTSTTSTDPYLAGTRAAAGFSSTTDYAFFADAPAQISTKLNALLGGIEKSLLGSLKGETATSPPITYNYFGLRMVIPTAEMVSENTSYLWRGHLRAYDIQLDPAVEIWDAGQVLSSSSVGSDYTNGRAIYTWNTAVNPPVLVEVKTGNASTINTICGNCGVTADVVNFIRGYEPGSSTVQRSWLLGPVVNSTPAMIGGPEKWSRVTNHDNFQKYFASRHPMIYVGSSDGMLHAIDPADGKEIFALLPPDQIAKNVPNTDPLLSHYSSYAANNPTGQGRWPSQHIYGVANSPRYGDAYDVSVVFDSALPERYRTLLFVTEGPGGKTLATLDVSHPYPGRTGVTVYGQSGTKDFDADPQFAWMDGNGAGANPIVVKLLWAKTGTTSPAMGYTWSIPAMALNSDTSSVVSVGSGVTTDTNHPSYVFGALAGNLLGTLNTGTRSGSLVTSQAFADSTIWSTDIYALGFKSDNLANEVLQADLGGRVWSQNIGSSGSTILDPGGTHPLYYSASVSMYGQGSASKILYAFASGTYYEKSPAVTGPSSSFRGTLFLAAKDIATSAVQSYNLALTDVPITGGTSGATLSDMAQVTSAPVLFVPRTLGRVAYILCTVFDPDPTACGGNSYLVMLSFDPTDLTSGASSPPTGSSVSVGSGFASGFALAGGQVIVAVSSTTGIATPVVAQGVSVNVAGGPQGSSDLPNYYVELQ